MSARRFAVLAGAALLMMVTRPALADDGSDAARHFEQGTALLEQDRCEDAIVELEAALKLSPGIGARYNLGLCFEKLGRLGSAWRAFEAVAELARSTGRTAREDAARAKMRELRPRLSVFSLRFTDGGALDATVKLDGVYVPPESWTFLPVNPGRHDVHVAASARDPWAIVLDAPSPGEVRVVEIPRLQAPAARARVVTVTKPVSDTRRTLAFGLGALGLVGAATAGITGIFLLDAKSTADERCTPSCRDASGALDQEGVDAVNRGRVLLPINAVAFGMAAVGLAAGAVLLLTGGSGRAAASPRASARGFTVAF